MSDEQKQIDLNVNSVVIPAKVYSDIVGYLVKKFTYSDILPVINDLNKYAYTVPNEYIVQTKKEGE